MVKLLQRGRSLKGLRERGADEVSVGAATTPKLSLRFDKAKQGLMSRHEHGAKLLMNDPTTPDRVTSHA